VERNLTDVREDRRFPCTRFYTDGNNLQNRINVVHNTVDTVLGGRPLTGPGAVPYDRSNNIVGPAFTFVPADEEEDEVEEDEVEEDEVEEDEVEEVDEDDLIVIPQVAPDAAGNNGLNINMLEEDSEVSDPPRDLERSIDNADLSFLDHRAGAKRKSRT
jgi:hypothetical protein